VCREQFEADRPAVVIGTGGLASVPAVREAHRAGIATALLNPDAQPGRANRNLSGMADVVFAQWEETAACLPRRTPVAVLGCPVRPEFLRADRAAGIARFGLDPLRNTLLVTGASQGARTINDAILANLDFFESLDNWQILHLTGDRDHEEVRRGYAGRSVRATVLAYTDQMADALAAADLVVSRAGASTLAELTAVGRAGILMPYPYDRGRHQLTNARCLERAGAARIVTDAIDSVVNGEALCGALRELTSRNDLRASMASAARRMGRGDAAERIAERILNLVAPREAQAYDESMESVCAPTR
jgi:UDP-N-acetylglucosamine--N-acetylmuramyl-(pentapeptide) pyrophosphoryl-undecaprenol N-acetylglucosamine transferase